MLVTDILLQYVDSLMAERIQALAKVRQRPANDIMLDALRHGLGIFSDGGLSETRRDADASAFLEGHWETAERGVFEEALHALAQAAPTQFAPERIRASQWQAEAE